MIEHHTNLEARLHALEVGAALGAELDAEQSGDLAAQVHLLTAYVKGMVQQSGYVHRQPVRA